MCGSWDTRECVKNRFGCTSRADSVQLERPEYWLHKIFGEAATLSLNANCRSNLPEMPAECSTAFPDIRESYLFLALYISKTDRRINKVSIKNENAKGLNPIQDGHFRCCSRIGGDKKAPSLKSVTHIYNDETWHSCTLPKENPKNIRITWHTPWVLLTSAFFQRKSANFVISRNTDTYCILIHSF